MKRRYQIDQQRAVQEFRQLAREQNPNIQMIFPMADIVGLLQEGVGHLLREAGLALMNLVMEERSTAPGGRASPTASRAARSPLGKRGRLLRGGRAEGADPENASAHPGKSRATAGQLRTVSAQWAAGARGMGQDDAWVVDAQLRSAGEGVWCSLRGGEVGGERQLHRGQPGEVAGVDGASAGRVAAVRC
jgi:hypothetical protein